MSEIMIVGAGPTGLTLACQLWRRGVPCRVIDAAPGAGSRSRALGMSARSLEVLDEFGAAEELVELGVRCGVADFNSRGRRIGRVTASSARHTRFPFMLALPQSQTVGVLERHLNRLGGTVEWGVRLRGLTQDAGGVDLTLDGAPATRTGWLVGADGERGVVRALAGIGYTPTETSTAFVNVDAYVDGGPPLGAGHYYFSAGAMTVLVGISGGWYRITTTVDAGKGAGEPLTPDGVAAVVSERTGRPLRIRELRDCGWGLARVRIRTGVADAMRAGRCLLAGDAAHVYGPVGAQGMNAGIQDAHNLAWKLALVVVGRAGGDLLESYQAERLPVAHATLEHAALQTRLATVGSAAGIVARDALVSVATGFGLLDRRLGPTVTQLDIGYPAVDRFRGSGTRLPDTAIGTHGPETLFDVLRQRPFTALVLDAAKLTDLDAVAGPLRERFGDLVAVRPMSRSGAGNGLLDRDGRLHRNLRVRGPRVCVVRPDGHVAFQCRPTDPVAERLGRFLLVHKTTVSTKQ